MWWVPLRRSIAPLLTSWRSEEDSVILWKAVCSNKLLAKLILFMNKCDILDAKMRSGVRLAKYLRSFGDCSNDPDTAQKCEFACAGGRSALLTAEH